MAHKNVISQHLHQPKIAFIDVGPGQTYTTPNTGGTFHVHGVATTGYPPATGIDAHDYASLELTANHPAPYNIDLGYNSTAWIEGMGPTSYDYNNTTHELRLWAGNAVIDAFTVTGRPFSVLSGIMVAPNAHPGTYITTGFVAKEEALQHSVPVHQTLTS